MKVISEYEHQETSMRHKPEPIPRLSSIWQHIDTAPKDRPIEVVAPPHSYLQGNMIVIWTQPNFGVGGWRWHPHRGGLMFPIYPTAWREITL